MWIMYDHVLCCYAAMLLLDVTPWIIPCKLVSCCGISLLVQICQGTCSCTTWAEDDTEDVDDNDPEDASEAFDA